MKYGLHSLVYPNFLDGREEQKFSYLKDLGYDYLELIPYDFDVDFKLLRTKADDHGIKINLGWSLGPEHNLTSEDTKVRQQGVDFLKKLIDLSSILGSEVISGLNYSGCGCLTGKPPTELEIHRSIDSYVEVIDYLGDSETLICLEPSTREDSHMLNTARDALEFISQIDSPKVKLCLDTYQMIREEASIEDVVLATKDDIGYIHASENHRGVIGKGLFNWEFFFYLLDMTGYDSIVTVESFFSSESPTAFRSKTWRSLAFSPEQVASESISFLKSFPKIGV